MRSLLLYSRQGCCLCQGLEERLLALDLESWQPPLQLSVIDIDQADNSEELRARYDLEVPVLALSQVGEQALLVLPRVSPRLSGEGLRSWLRKHIV